MPSILEPAPDFRAPAVVGQGDFIDVALSDYRGKYVVLFFYPLDFTTVCPTEIMEFSRRLPEFEALNTRLLGASCDSQFSHKAWLQHALGEVKYPLVADFTKDIARSYGVLRADGYPSRATFIVDPEGVLQYACQHSPNVGRSVSEILRSLDAIQTGQLTPVEWKRGQATL